MDNFKEKVRPGIETIHWGWHDGKEIFLYKITNNKGTTVAITNFGAIIQSFILADGANIVLGYTSLQEYVNDPFYMGGIVGRYSGRIAGGNIFINGNKYNITTTAGGYHHHGGESGFNKKVWSAKEGRSGVELHYVSADKEEGFPGNLDVTVIYSLNDENELSVDISAATDHSTLINLTQHTYFNLAGSTSILNHVLTIGSDYFIPVNTSVIPTGEISPVKNTPFDFVQPNIIGERINVQHEQLLIAGGYDHSYVLRNNNELVFAASVIDPASGRKLIVTTTEPAVHFYSGNYLEGAFVKYAGLCLETQHFSDSPNHPHFPSTVLEPGDIFTSKTVYRIQ